MMSRWGDAVGPDLWAELIRVACQEVLRQAQAKGEPPPLIQCLLPPGQTPQARALRSAGMIHLADLAYQQRPAYRRGVRLWLPEALRVSHWSQATRPLFERAILGSYEQTQDCPRLVHRRRIEHVLEAHAAQGRFEPDLWFVLHQGHEPVGVMLLAEKPERLSLELVYLGLCPRWRGGGLARVLLRHALGLCRSRGADRLSLSVDEHNEPAMGLYRSMGFATTLRKSAFIMLLP
jgi:ribosomal protein S18 acetylase RimI-like enzyme